MGVAGWQNGCEHAMNHSTLTTSRFVIWVTISGIAALLVLAVSPGIGSQPIGVVDAWRHWGVPESTTHYIAFQLRLPRAVTAMVAGATLALCGAVFQSLFRNVLATPYTLGVASGGSLGHLIGMKLGFVGVYLGLGATSWCALAGSAIVVALVFMLAGTTFRLAGNALVLAGVTIGLFCGAMMMFVTYIADVHETFTVVRWMMGSLEGVGYGAVTPIAGPLILAWIVLMYHAKALNQFDLGHDIAASRGVPVRSLLLVTIAFASLATACVVSTCGPIGFVGLLVPHIVRLGLGRDHRLLLPIAGLWGGVFLVVCDWLTRLAPLWYASITGRHVGASTLPIGVMTSVIGAPVFLVLLSRANSGRRGLS